MLYDRRWDRKVETKAGPFTREILIAWLEKQPAYKSYDFLNCEGECLLGQYLTAHGLNFRDDYLALMSKAPAFCRVGIARPWTFGAALDRARAYV